MPMADAHADLIDRVRIRLAADDSEVTPARVAEAVRREGVLVADHDVLALVDRLHGELVGLGPLDPLVQLDGVTDIVVNGPDAVFVDDGAGLRRVPGGFPDEGSVRRLAQRLAAAVGRRLDDAAPFVDARLPGGIRLHAVLAPPAIGATCLSLRVPSRTRRSLGALAAAGLLDPAGEQVLRHIVRARLPFLISGGTGSGKTTLLGALLGGCDPRERLVIVEDAVELRPQHPHVVSLEARPPNVEGRGEVTVRDLVRQALRMRPDRLVVGEVRGAEVLDLLTALNTGHAGGCGTVHANSAADVPARFEALGLVAGMTRDAVHAQLGAAIDVVIHLRRGRDGTRRVTEIAVLQGIDGVARATPALRFAAGAAVPVQPGFDRLETLLAGDAEA